MSDPLAKKSRPIAAASAEGDLRVVTLPHLIALEIYSGRGRDRTDVIELLTRNPDAIDATREVCSRFGFAGPLEALLRDAGL